LACKVKEDVRFRGSAAGFIPERVIEVKIADE
jgi:hypothetical protein